jgi:hypothetical protein
MSGDKHDYQRLDTADDVRAIMNLIDANPRKAARSIENIIPRNEDCEFFELHAEKVPDHRKFGVRPSIAKAQLDDIMRFGLVCPFDEHRIDRGTLRTIALSPGVLAWLCRLVFAADMRGDTGNFFTRQLEKSAEEARDALELRPLENE